MAGRTREVWANGAADEAMFQVIRKGVPGTEMPQSNRPDHEILQIIAYLRNIGTVAPGLSAWFPVALRNLFNVSNQTGSVQARTMVLHCEPAPAAPSQPVVYNVKRNALTPFYQAMP